MTKLNHKLTGYCLLIFFFLLESLNIQAQTSERWIPSDSVFARYLQSQHISIINNNKLTLLPSGKEKFTHLFSEIRKAKHHVHLEYFNFRNDSIANALFDLLAQKVDEGVEVRAMFDAFGNMSNNRPLRKRHLEKLRNEGIEIVTFDPITFPYVNHVASRDHQKIVVIDGITSYTGGMNIADYYINGLPKIGPWRDMHLCIKGPASEELQRAFLIMWDKETKQHISGKAYFPYGKDSLEALPAHSGGQVAIVQRVPKVSPKAMRRAYIAAIDAAEHKIQIINPYFVPTVSIRRAIERALERGVKVEIMIPGKSDISFTPDAGFYFANKLRKKGARIYIYNGGFHHSKVMMIDDRFCTVGSTNLNSRSLRYDYELNAFLFDLPITDQLATIFAQDKQNSTVMTKDVYRDRTPWKRFVGWFAHLLTPVL
ncbi:cardiolipin synthase [Bacteroides sp. An322]|uniref:cardiolipin synthase n=1 Tax=Bacteroides sp. An322 TaxID=1965632 RepID=UPI000B374F05|nr:cardiolipin synthase [Bacteroides sp. An322]OUO18197.1 cardiolipin synthase [Bacteroides sp. An322]